MSRCQWQDNKKTVWIMRTFQTNPDYIKVDLSCKYLVLYEYVICIDSDFQITSQLVQY